MPLDAHPARRGRLDPAVAEVRLAVRAALGRACPGGSGTGREADAEGTLVLVGLSGGADSLALAAALAFEAPRRGLRAGAIVVDHALQDGSAEVAERAAAQATGLGLDPVRLVRVDGGAGAGGPEAAARAARFGAFATVAREERAAAVLLAHTLDDQAETVLLGLARGSGATSLAGMAASAPLTPDTPVESSILAGMNAAFRPKSTTRGERRGAVLVRPLLGVRRRTTRACCAASGLEPWEDPQNAEERFARVRVRREALPTLERTLGPGVTEALARTAALLREDAEALDAAAAALVREALPGEAPGVARAADDRGRGPVAGEDPAREAPAVLAVPVAVLAAAPPAVRHRALRRVAARFGALLEAVHVREVERLVTDWRGQGPLDLPRVRVARRDGSILFRAADD